MTEQKEMYYKLLKMLDYDLDSEVDSGTLTKIFVDKKIMGIIFYISFPNLIPFDKLVRLKKDLEKLAVTKMKAKTSKAFFSIENKHLNEQDIESIYKNILEYTSINNPKCGALDAFVKLFDTNKISFGVANEDEKTIATALVEDLKSNFNDFGLGFIKVEININEFASPIEDEIQTSINASLAQAQRDLKVQETTESAPKKENKWKTMKSGKKQALNEKATPLSEIPATEYSLNEYTERNFNNLFVVEGEVITSEIKKLKGDFTIYEGTITDGTSSIVIKTFINKNNPDFEPYLKNECCSGHIVRVYGKADYDKFSRDVVIKIYEIVSREKEQENKSHMASSEPRVELHAHTKMSAQDAVLDIEDYVNRALDYGYKALAVTDHYNIQIFPDFKKLATKKGLKPIFGVEGRLVNESTFKVALTDEDIDLQSATYVVYDFETTGFSSTYNEIIEIGACKVRNGMIVEEFSEFIKPSHLISNKITSITQITNDDVRNAKPVSDVLPRFWKFIGDAILVAHNATFDNSHLFENLRKLGINVKTHPTIDTLQFARIYYGDKLKKFGLDYVCKLFGVELEQHHRACDDAKATCEIFMKMLKGLYERKIYNYNEINNIIDDNEAYKHALPNHITLLVKNKEGLLNLNKIISQSHTVNFHREPRILKKFLETHREGLLVGSACYHGEVFETALNKSYDELLEKVSFYDYLEVQPIEGYSYLIEDSEGVTSKEILQDVVKKIIRAGREKNKIVVATGDVHFLEQSDSVLRKMLVEVPLVGGGLHELSKANEMPEQYFKNTETMLDQFDFLGTDVAHEIVVTNTNKISDMIEEFDLFPKKLFAPADNFLEEKGVPSAKQGVIDLTYETAYRIYGNPLPKIVQDRLDKELNSIIGNDYATIYYISYLLVKHSKDDGYVVGSRGSVGSSLVATFMGITEVNSLPPHYVCPKCHFSSFKLNSEEKKIYHQSKEAEKLYDKLEKVGTGFDLPEEYCPICGEKLVGNGCDIPFETFLGFKGDKVPDIDLNFSGDYQAKAHNFCREVFGNDYTFRAGTISAIQDNTAYGYVKGHSERIGKPMRQSDIKRLASGLCGVKRSTGQHPGGIVVVPKGIDINEITPVQYPADDNTNEWYTTHHGYHDFEKNLLKLDILGHDDPTMIRHLMNFVDKHPEEFPFRTVEEIPLSDKDVLSLFNSVEKLGVNSSQVKMDIGTTGLPEFGTTMAKDMLKDIRPKTVSDLIKISGLSHGTNVWNGNARDYFLGIKPGYDSIPFNELIGCRDDIMLYLLDKELPAIDAFKIMEDVRHGKGLKPEQEEEMLKYNVPKWYIESCKAIKYMFPKAHASAYVIMALRIGWFKLYRPIYYYSGFFSRRANAFDVETMAMGYEAIFNKVTEFENKIANKEEMSNKDYDVYATLQLALEMTARGFTFRQIDIDKSDWRDFIVEGNSLLIPFIALDSLGESTAKSIVEARNVAKFTSIKDLSRRTRLSNTLIERLRRLKVLDNLSEEDQLGIFGE